MTEPEYHGEPIHFRRPTIAFLMLFIGLAALLLAPLVWFYRDLLRERAVTQAMRYEVEQSAYRANAERQRVQVELQKATLYAPRPSEEPSDSDPDLRYENQRLREELAQLKQRVAELEDQSAQGP